MSDSHIYSLFAPLTVSHHPILFLLQNLDNPPAAPTPLPKLSGLLQNQDQISQNPIPRNDPHHNSNPRPLQARMIIKRLQYRRPPYLSHARQITLIHAMIPAHRISRTSVYPVFEFINHHALKDVGLIIDIVKNVFPENIQCAHRNKEAVHAHPEPISESRDCEGDYEDRENRTDENDEGFCGDEIEEEPEHPDPEGVRCVVEISEPVCHDGEEHGDEEEIRETDQEIRDCEG